MKGWVRWGFKNYVVLYEILISFGYWRLRSLPLQRTVTFDYICISQCMPFLYIPIISHKIIFHTSSFTQMRYCLITFLPQPLPIVHSLPEPVLSILDWQAVHTSNHSTHPQSPLSPQALCQSLLRAAQSRTLCLLLLHLNLEE
jgi:hypothetical protein